MYFSKNVKYLRHMRAISQKDLARMLGYKSFTTIQKWEDGTSQPPFDKAVMLADILGVNVTDLYKLDMESEKYILSQVPSPDRVPVFGSIPAGVPLEAIEDIRGYVDAPLHTVPGKDYFALEISGDSMMPDYRDGDIVIFERADSCENGDACAVRLSEGDVTFKKVRKNTDYVILQPLNPDYAPIHIDGSAASSDLEIIGIAKEIRRRV